MISSYLPACFSAGYNNQWNLQVIEMTCSSLVTLCHHTLIVEFIVDCHCLCLNKCRGTQDCFFVLVSQDLDYLYVESTLLNRCITGSGK